MDRRWMAGWAAAAKDNPGPSPTPTTLAPPCPRAGASTASSPAFVTGPGPPLPICKLEQSAGRTDGRGDWRRPDAAGESAMDRLHWSSSPVSPCAVHCSGWSSCSRWMCSKLAQTGGNKGHAHSTMDNEQNCAEWLVPCSTSTVEHDLACQFSGCCISRPCPKRDTCPSRGLPHLQCAED